VTIYPEKDVALLQQPDETMTSYDSSYFSVPNDQAQPEVDIALLPGVPGQRGPQGPQGIQGAPGGNMMFTKSEPSNTWVIAHYLGFNPNVTVVDSLGNDCVGTITYNNNSGLTITFNQPISGTAYLS
jgi:hypothetical protein